MLTSLPETQSISLVDSSSVVESPIERERSYTNTFETISLQLFFSMASSTIFFNFISFVPLTPTSAVITTFELEAAILEDSASLEKPAKTTEWIAPIRAAASMVIGS